MKDVDRTNPAAIAIRFNDHINCRDLDGLANLMSDDHTFIDSAGGSVTGRDACLDAWQRFFAAFPDYRNVFASVSAHDDIATIIGHSVCSQPILAGPALWTARISDCKIREWRVYQDTPEVRRRLDLAALEAD